MKRIFWSILMIPLLTSCNNQKQKATEEINRKDTVSAAGKVSKTEEKKPQEPGQASCIFSDPDTSVSGIKIRDAESTLMILGKQTKLAGDSTHIFYSTDKKQKLGLTVHPGDYYSQVSIFNISYAENPGQSLRLINTKEFKTEKGIKLGLSKREIIGKLGTCYIAKDSTQNSIGLVYRLELPEDSRTELLMNHHMPIYYGIYRFTNDKLKNIEFGFEYP